MKTKSLLIAALAFGVVAAPASATESGMTKVEVLTEKNQANDPDEIIAKYIQAIGGKANVGKIKNAVMTMEAEMQGMAIEIKGVTDQENSRFLQETSVMGNVASKTILVNGKGKMIAMGQENEIPDDMIDAMKTQTYVFPEEHYSELGFSVELQGTEDVDGEEASKLIITAPNGMQTVDYYSVASGLKIRTSSEATGDITYSDYEEIDGVKIPMKLTIQNPMMPAALVANVVSIKFNQTLSDSDFED